MMWRPGFLLLPILCMMTSVSACGGSGVPVALGTTSPAGTSDPNQGSGASGVATQVPTDANASSTPTATGGPNGSQAWFNRGIDGNGWDPPMLDVNAIVTISSNTFVQKFSAMAPFAGMVRQGLADNNLSTEDRMLTLAMAIAMQESGGDPSAAGPTPGLFQVDPSNYKPGQDPTAKTYCVDRQGMIYAGHASTLSLGPSQARYRSL